MKISCNLVPSPDVVRQAKLAEALGYDSVFLTDAPALYFDVWVSLALVAQATETIGIGTGVLVPFTRHPVVNATAIVTLDALAPGRLRVALGAGNSARRTLGERRPSKLDWLQAYIEALRGLLQGDTVVWEGKKVCLIGIEGLWPKLPVTVPLLMNAIGPRGLAVARECADGTVGAANRDFETSIQLCCGTVLDDGEALTDERAILAHGPMVLTAIHNMYEDAPEQLSGIPGGDGWRERIDALAPPDERHLVVHRGHCVQVTPQDREFVGSSDFLAMSALFGSFSGPAEAVRATMTRYAEAGASEVDYLPAGPDIDRELRAFAEAVHGL